MHCATFVDVAWCCTRLARFVQQCCARTCALVRFATPNMSGQHCCDVPLPPSEPPHTVLLQIPCDVILVAKHHGNNQSTKQSINNLTPREPLGWQGIIENASRTSTNCGHTSFTDDTSAGLKCSATVRVCSTLAASRRLFLAGSDFSSAWACWYVSFPSAIYSTNNNKRDYSLHLKLKTLWCALATKRVTTIWQTPFEQ